MIDEPFTDDERLRLLHLTIAAVPLTHGDPMLTSIMAKLTGVDTVLYARRAYPARTRDDGTGFDMTRLREIIGDDQEGLT